MKSKEELNALKNEVETLNKKLAELNDDWKDVQNHEEYYSELCQKHYRKKAFWFYFK